PLGAASPASAQIAGAPRRLHGVRSASLRADGSAHAIARAKPVGTDVPRGRAHARRRQTRAEPAAHETPDLMAEGGAGRRRRRASPSVGPAALAERQRFRIAVLGGTGAQGSALAVRLANAGHEIIIGSRDPAKAHATAAKLREGTGQAITGADNAGAAGAGE